MRSNIFSRWYKVHSFPGNRKWSFLYLIENHTTFHFLLRCLKIIRLVHYVYTYQISHAFMEWKIFLPPLTIILSELDWFCVGFERNISQIKATNIMLKIHFNFQTNTTYVVEIFHTFYWYVQHTAQKKLV